MDITTNMDPRLRPDVVAQLVATGKWSKGTAILGEQALYCCEYCGRNLLHCPECYKLWQVDHIIPVCKGGEKDDPANKAIACKTCNWDWKGCWDPSRGEKGLDRKVLIERIRAYVRERRERTNRELAEACEIIFGKGVTNPAASAPCCAPSPEPTA